VTDVNPADGMVPMEGTETEFVFNYTSTPEEGAGDE